MKPVISMLSHFLLFSFRYLACNLHFYKPLGAEPAGLGSLWLGQTLGCTAAHTITSQMRYSKHLSDLHL